ncbi:MAG TPA: hypothetical protein VER11_01530 [Polyangiaceae bacterium]|nr:hypothetical protein [Polyangiaceae bacterium]
MSKLVRKATARAGRVSALDLDVIEVSGFGPMGAAVSAVRDGDGHLELTKWDITADGGSIACRAAAHAGSVSEVATTVVNSHLVTAVKNGSGHLEAISWSQDLVRVGSATNENASQIAISAFRQENEVDSFATGHRDLKGNLKVDVWSLSESGAPAWRGGASAGAASEVSLAFLGSGTGLRYRFLSATRNRRGELELIQWSASSDGATVQRLGSTTAGGASQISLCSLGDLIFTSLRDGAGTLQIISWRARSNGTIERLDTARAGSVEDISSALSFDASGAQFLTTAVRNGSNELELIDWQVHSSGVLQRASSALVGTASLVRVRCAWNSRNPAAVNPAPRTVLLTALRNGSSDLELVSWTRES